MDQKSWLWKKRSTEKTLEADKAYNSLRRNDEVNEIQQLLTEKADLERDLRISNEKLSVVLSDGNANDSITKKQVKIAQEAIAGWEKADAEAISLKKELDETLQQKASYQERSNQLDAALKECMHQLRVVREDASNRLIKLEAENTQLIKSLSGKDKVIEDISKYRSKIEADYNSLVLRFGSTEKENASLKYEVRVLEKDLEIRNEEREFNRQTFDVAQQHQQESIKKIEKLESECQKLRLLVQKRLPGQAALAKMKNEVEILKKDQILMGKDENRIRFLIEQLHILEEENKRLKDALSKKSSHVLVEKSLKDQPIKYLLREHSIAASSDMDEKASCAESWGSNLLPEQFKNEKHFMRISDMNLMDDFIEMEKLAVVSVDNYPAESSHHSSEEGRDVVPDFDLQSEPLISSQEINKNGQILQPKVSLSLYKILGLLEGINLMSQDNGNDARAPAGYMVRVFQWKSTEIHGILQQFVQTCNALLNGTADLEKFVEEVAYNLDWIMNHCFSIQDVSSMKDAIRNQLDWDESRSESEVDCGSIRYSVESSRFLIQRDDFISCQVESLHSKMKEEDSESKESSLVDRLQKELVKDESFRDRLEDTKNMVENLQLDMELTKHCEGNSEDQIEVHNSLLLENEHEYKSSSSRRKDEPCNDLQMKSVVSKEAQEIEENQERQLQNDLDITAASEKLAECQETILNLGKQLKALATPKDSHLFDEFIPTSDVTLANGIHRTSLLDKMLAEDKNKQTQASSTTMKSSGKLTTPNGNNHGEDRTVSGALSTAISPYNKRQGRTFFQKLFWRIKKGKSKKT